MQNIILGDSDYPFVISTLKGSWMNRYLRSESEVRQKEAGLFGSQGDLRTWKLDMYVVSSSWKKPIKQFPPPLESSERIQVY